MCDTFPGRRGILISSLRSLCSLSYSVVRLAHARRAVRDIPPLNVMSSPSYDTQTLRQEFSRFLAFEILARLKYANPPAFLPSWRGHGDGPTKNSKSAWYAFRAEFIEVLSAHAHVIVTLYPEISDASQYSALLSRLASASWRNCKNIASILELSEEAHARGCAMGAA